MSDVIDSRYYQVARTGTLAERLVITARDRIYDDFLRITAPTRASTILDVGVSDVLGDAANMLERKYPHLYRVSAVGLGVATAFRNAFPAVAYRQVQPGRLLPFAPAQFGIATSNAVLEHVGSPAAQQAFVAELARIAQTVFITVPNRFFPVEHHTGIPLLHWTAPTFALACRALSKQEWTDPAALILMTKSRLARLANGLDPALLAGRTIEVGSTGIGPGPFASNLYLAIGAPVTKAR